jgi:response regulator RpfG family c-di-GMP phosphodiesterase
MASARGDPMYHRIQVLVVDDDAAIREFLRMLLEEEGYTVFEATDGITALDILRSGPEGMVVYMTASGPDFPPSLEQRLRELHIPVLRKPFELDAFLSAVARAAGCLSPAYEPRDEHAHT